MHLVWKPNNGGWRFTIDYKSFNKVIFNEGWQIPNMNEMLVRIGSKKPKCIGVADLIYQIPLHENSRALTAFIGFRDVYEWTLECQEIIFGLR